MTSATILGGRAEGLTELVDEDIVYPCDVEGGVQGICEEQDADLKDISDG